MIPSSENAYVPKEIADKWPQYEFIGKPMKLRDGKTYIRAHSTVFGVSHFYCFEDDFIWCGCFWGSLDEFESQVRNVHASNAQYLKEYLGAISYIRSLKEVNQIENTCIVNNQK